MSFCKVMHLTPFYRGVAWYCYVSRIVRSGPRRPAWGDVGGNTVHWAKVQLAFLREQHCKAALLEGGAAFLLYMDSHNMVNKFWNRAPYRFECSMKC